MELRTAPKPDRTVSDSLQPPPTSPPPPSKISRVLYLDLDLHHGDGVEAAFFSSPHVLTLSLHLFAPLFFPATGALDSTGPTGARAPAAGHALNLALEPGLGDETFRRVWDSCVEKIVGAYGPDAVVVQLGVDGLANDPCKVGRVPSNLGLLLHRHQAHPRAFGPPFTSPLGMEPVPRELWLRPRANSRSEATHPLARRWRLSQPERRSRLDVPHLYRGQSRVSLTRANLSH